MDNTLLDMSSGERDPRVRRLLLRRLVDVVALPASEISPQERAIAGDILLELMVDADPDDRELCARRLAERPEAPPRLLRWLACSDYQAARHLLNENAGLDESVLVQAASAGSIEHRLAIARREDLRPVVCESLMSFAETQVTRTLLENRKTRLPDGAMDLALDQSRTRDDLPFLLTQRPELQPSHAMAMFWWADTRTRREILERFTSDRLELIAALADLFPLAAREKWTDPAARKVLQLVERRQRNRDAIARSPFDSLEQAVEVAAVEGMNPELAQEIGYLAGVKPLTIAKVLSDPGGEPVAVLCKATGLKRPYLERMWRALRRPVSDMQGNANPHYAHVEMTYDILTVFKAETTLRYWNWSLSAAYAPSAEPGESDVPASRNRLQAGR